MSDQVLLVTTAGPLKAARNNGYLALSADLDQTSLNGGGTISFTQRGTLTMTKSLSVSSNTQIYVGAGVTIDATGLSAACFTSSSTENVSITGPGVIVCTSSTVPSFTNVDGLTVDVRIEDADGAPLEPVIRGGIAPLRAEYPGGVLIPTGKTYGGGEPFPRKTRITDGGKAIYNFLDHTAFTASGETSGYTLSTVSGVDGIAYDSSGSRTGSTAMVKLVVSGQAGAANFIMSGPSSMGVSMGSNLFGLWMYYSPDSTYTGNTIHLLTSKSNSFPGTADYDVTFTSNQIRPGWNFLVFNTQATYHPFGIVKNSGTEDYSTGTLSRIGFYMKVTNGTTATFYFDSLWTAFANTPAIVLGFDGTFEDDAINYTLPIFQERGLRGYVAASSNASDGVARWDDLNGAYTGQATQLANMAQFVAAEWDIINHNLNHTNVLTGSGGSALSSAQLQYQLLMQRAWQIAHGALRGSEFWAAPQGAWNWASVQAIKAHGFVSQRNGSQHWNTTQTPFGIDQKDNVGWYSMDAPVSWGAGSTANLANWQAAVNTSISYQADLWMGFHQVIAGGTSSSATGNSLQIYGVALEAFLDWLLTLQAAGTIQLMTPTEWYYGLPGWR